MISYGSKEWLAWPPDKGKVEYEDVNECSPDGYGNLFCRNVGRRIKVYQEPSNYFKGDVIITDPCYIIKERKLTEEPILGAWTNLEDLTKHTDLVKKWKQENVGDWERTGGVHMGLLGLKKFISRRTEYGDWSCTTFLDNDASREAGIKLMQSFCQSFYETNFNGAKTKKQKAEIHKRFKEKSNELSKGCLGSFCADAGMVAVFLLEEVLAYNPDFDYHINRTWTTTWIKDFDGIIDIAVKGAQSNREVFVAGRGNINFFTTQTGL